MKKLLCLTIATATVIIQYEMRFFFGRGGLAEVIWTEIRIWCSQPFDFATKKRTQPTTKQALQSSFQVMLRIVVTRIVWS